MDSKATDFQDVLWVAVPKVLGGAIQVCFGVVLVRFLGPKSFGMLSVCLAAVIVCDSIFGSAIDMSIFRLAPLYRDRNPLAALQIEKAGLVIKPIGALVAILPIAFFGPRLSRALFQTPNGAPLLYLTLVALLGSLLIRSTQVHFQIERRFRLYGVTDLLDTFLCFGTISVLLLAGIRSPGKILAVYAGVPIIVSAIVLATLARKMALTQVAPEATRALLRTLKWFLVTVIVGSLFSRMDLFFVSAFAGVQEAGIYSAAQIFALLPALMGLYLSAVFSPRVMPLWQEGKLKPIYIRYQAGLAVTALLTYFLSLLLLPRLTSHLLPESFRRSSDVILALLPAGLCSFLSFPWTIPFLLYMRPKLLVVIDCIGLAILAPLYIGIARHAGAVGVAALTSGAMLVRTLIHQWLAWRMVSLGCQIIGVPGQEVLEGELALVRTA
jgi:O-antigen/teichoic acid export membrane protein